MKWSSRDIQLLTKKVFGNLSDEDILRKAAELRLHFDKFEHSFLSTRVRHEWAEVERLADEIQEMLRKEETHGKVRDPIP